MDTHTHTHQLIFAEFFLSEFQFSTIQIEHKIPTHFYDQEEFPYLPHLCQCSHYIISQLCPIQLV